MSRARLLVPALIAGASFLAPAADPVVIQPAKAEAATETRTLPLAAGSELKVKNVNGHIRVQAWDRAEVSFTGEFKPSSKGEQVKVVLESTAKGLEIRGEHPKRSGESGSYRGPECTMTLKVPRQVLASLSSVNGDVVLDGVQGQADCQTVNGSVQAKNLEERLKAETVNGSIRVDQAKGALSLRTVNGSIEAKGLDGKGGGIEAESVNGSVRFQVGTAKGHFKASSTNGKVQFNASGATEVEAKRTKVSALLPGSDQAIQIRTVNGSITVD